MKKHFQNLNFTKKKDLDTHRPPSKGELYTLADRRDRIFVRSAPGNDSVIFEWGRLVRF